jgi:hypothetical protein
MYKYEIASRLFVPGTNGAQGVIVDRWETVPGFPVYKLCWLDTEAKPQDGSCGESDLAAVNMTSAERLAVDAARSQAEKAIERRVTALVAAKLRARKTRARKR